MNYKYLIEEFVDPTRRKKMKAAAIGVLVVIFNKKLELGLSVEEIALIAFLLGTFILGQGAADHGKEKL